MDRCLKDKAHFIISQTIWNNKNGKAVFAEQVFDRCAKKFQDEINRELYKLIEEGGGGQGKDGKTPVLTAGDAKPLPNGSVPTVDVVYTGNDAQGNPIYRIDLGIPVGKDGTDGNDGNDGITPELRLTEQGIEVSYNNGATWTLLVPIDRFAITNNITNNYINNADEEDITVIDDKLKFADKTYDANQFSGLGRIYLRKNIVDGKNILTQSMINATNTIYIIQYNYDLNGATITIPDNSILQFNGGTLSNGIINGNNAVIHSNLIKIFDDNIFLKGNWNITYIYPEWFGAIPYKKDVLTKPTGVITLSKILEESNIAFDKLKDVLINTNIHSICLSALYYITKEVDINVTQYYNSGINITGNGTNTGFIAQINDISASVISINKNSKTISQYDYLSNFAIYITNDSQLDSAILLHEIIRSTCSDIKVYGGFAKFEKGIYHLHSVENNNIFLNVFDKCVGVNTMKGGGIHYSQETYQPTLQSISNCIFQQLAGAAIESEPTPITGGGFGGIIISNELEGNNKGAIAIGGVHNLAVKNNYFESSDYSNMINYFDNVPPAVFTFGIITGSAGDDYITNVINLDISNNQIGASKGTLDYAIIMCSTQTGGRTLNVNISNNIINSSGSKNVGIKYITRLQHCNSINIINNQFNVNNDDVDKNFPIDLIDKGASGINYSYGGNKVCHDYNYKFSHSKGLGIIRTNAFDTITNYPYLLPKGTSVVATLYSGDFIFLETNNTIYKVIKGGKLHYNTDATFTESSNIINCSGAIWDWKVGDIVNSDYINNGTAVITNINGNNFTISENATTTIKDWLTDAIVIPYELSSTIKTNGTTSNRPSYRFNKIPKGWQYFDTDLNKPVFWNGTAWVTYPDSSGSTMAELTFTGAVEATYNGSTPVTVNIPTGGGGGGEDGKTPVMQIGNVTTVAAGRNATADVRADGADPSGNPIYKVDFGIPRGSNGTDGDDDASAGFGEPTASAETVASDVAPSVVVTATGANTSKVFDFAFKIPKGKDGTNGNDGDNGLTPTIGENGNWMIGAVDTGVKAKGEDGLTGKTPVFETGEVVTGAAGTAAIVEVVINGVDETGNPKYLINFTIPRGADGIGSGGGTDRGRCIFTLEDYSAAYRPEIGLSKILPAIGGFALNDCIIDVTGSVRQVTAVSEDKQTANLSDALYTFPTGGGTGGVTEARVTEMINAVVGDINTILDNINGEVV